MVLSKITTTVKIEETNKSKEIRISGKCLEALAAESGDLVEVNLKIIRLNEGSAKTPKTEQELIKLLINTIIELSDEKYRSSKNKVINHMKKEYNVNEERTNNIIAKLYKKGSIYPARDYLKVTEKAFPR